MKYRLFLKQTVLFLVILSGGIWISRLQGSGLEKSNNKVHWILEYASTLRGYLEPCGCHNGQYGGVARRATYLEDLRNQNPNVLSVYNGDIGSFSSPQEKIKTGYLILAMEKMGYRAFNVGESEFIYGWDFIKAQAETHPFFISANLYNTKDNTLYFKPYVMQSFMIETGTQKVPLNIAIVGVISPFFESIIKDFVHDPHFPLTIKNPESVLKELVPELHKKADIVVVLAHMPFDQAESLADAVPNIDIIVAGHEPFQITETPVVKGHTLVVSNGDRGRYEATLGFHLNEKKRITTYSSFQRPLDEKIADNPQMKDLIKAFKQGLTLPENEPMTTEKTSGSKYSGNRYVGVGTCKKCHPTAYIQWRDSIHSKALNVLKDKGNDQRQECVVCHTVGYGTPEGFISERMTPLLAGVQCENCHQAGSTHASAPLKLKRTTIQKEVDAKTCMTCHDQEHDPGFDYETNLIKIKHW